MEMIIAIVFIGFYSGCIFTRELTRWMEVPFLTKSVKKIKFSLIVGFVFNRTIYFNPAIYF
jgi:hypothetical protein